MAAVWRGSPSAGIALFFSPSMLTIFASLLAVVSAAPGYRRQDSYGAPTVSVKNGTISGVHSSTYNEDYFLGIPYAQPPVNGLRFKVQIGRAHV